MRQCRKCGEEKPSAEFYKNRARADGRDTKCAECARRDAREYYRANREKISQKYHDNLEESRAYSRAQYHKNKEAADDRRLRSRFGIGLDEYRAMRAEQDGVCAICRGECETGDRLAVDHDHETGRVRGLLCRRCNGGIGFLRDDPEMAYRAAVYLQPRLRVVAG